MKFISRYYALCPSKVTVSFCLAIAASQAFGCGFDAPVTPAKTPPSTTTPSGSDAVAETPKGTPAAVAPPAPGERPTCPGLGTWDAQASQFEAEVLVRVNAARAKGGTCGNTSFAATTPLAANATLDCVARAFAKAMSDGDFFDHESPDGTGPFERMENAGLSLRQAGENIAVGQEDPEAVMEAWLESPGHCTNIFGNFKEIGIGYYQGYWVQDFMTAQ